MVHKEVFAFNLQMFFIANNILSANQRRNDRSNYNLKTEHRKIIPQSLEKIRLHL